MSIQREIMPKMTLELNYVARATTFSARKISTVYREEPAGRIVRHGQFRQAALRSIRRGPSQRHCESQPTQFQRSSEPELRFPADVGERG